MEHGLSDTYLESIGVRGQSKCVLVQRWTELLNPRTTATYRVRHLNAHGALREISELLDLVLDGTIGHFHLKPVRQECIQLLRDDMSIATRMPQHQQQCLRNLELLRSKQRSSQLRLKYQISHSLPQISEAYIGWLLDDLREAMGRSCVTAVVSLVSSLATELISMGWSRRALYEMRDLLVAALISENGWFDLVNALTRSKRRYECLFLVDNGLSEEENRAFEKLGLSTQERSQLLADSLYGDKERIVPSARRYLLARVDAFDPFSALEYAEAKLSSALDVLNLSSFGEVKLRDLRIIACRDGDRFRRVDADDKWMQLVSRFRSARFDTIVQCMIDSPLGRIDRNRYATALSYYRMGMQSMEPTAKFVNLWVSLESFCRTAAFDSIIECVTSRIPELLSTAYIYRLVRNYYEDCLRAGVDLLDDIIAVDVCAPKRLSITATVKLLRDPAGQEALKEATAFHSLLSERTKEMISLLSNPKFLAEALSSHRQRLYWHIQRLYRVRNSIVHTGTAADNLSALTEHLQDYVLMTLTRTAATIGSSKATGIDAALERAVDNYEATKAVLETGESLDDELLLNGPLG